MTKKVYLSDDEDDRACKTSEVSHKGGATFGVLQTLLHGGFRDG